MYTFEKYTLNHFKQRKKRELTFGGKIVKSMDLTIEDTGREAIDVRIPRKRMKKTSM